MTAPDLIRTRHVRACVDHQRSLGHAVGSQLERAGIPEACLADDAGALPARYFAAFLASACSTSQISAFSYRAAPPDLTAYPGLQHGIASSSNLLEAFAEHRLGATELSGLRLRLGVWENRTWIYATSTIPCLRHLGWSAYLLRPMIEIVRTATGPAWWPRTVCLPSAHTVRMEDLDLPPGVGIEPRVRRVAIEIPEHTLFRPTRCRTPHPEGLDEARGPELATDLAGTVRTLLKTYMGKRPLPISEIADLADCSVRSLQRELQSADCSFSSLLQEVRYLSSVPLLVNSDTSITDLAYELGYSDPAHFTRAFQRFSGTSPSAFRRLANAPA